MENDSKLRELRAKIEIFPSFKFLMFPLNFANKEWAMSIKVICKLRRNKASKVSEVSKIRKIIKRFCKAAKVYCSRKFLETTR